MLVLDPHDTDNWFRNEYADFPERMRESIRRYVLDGIMPGLFLQSVIANDLLGAVCRADNVNAPLLKQYAQWFHNVAPMSCCGSRDKLLAWIESGGMNATQK